MPARHRHPARRSARGLAACALLALAAAGCTGSSGGSAGGSPTGGASSGTSTSPPAVTGPVVSAPQAGIQLRLPAGWSGVPLGNGSTAVLRRVLHDPSAVASVQQQIRVGQARGLRLFAVQPRTGPRPGTLTVSMSESANASLDVLQQQLRVATEQFAATTPVFDRVTLPAGPSLRVHYRLTDGDSSTQYYVIAGPLAYTLTLTVPDRSPDLALDDAIARTLHLTNAA